MAHDFTKLTTEPGIDTWFVSDPHFYHKKVIKYCKRPWNTVEEMNEGLVKSWNAHIKPRDFVYLLGDISWKGKGLTKAILNRLNGRIALILGNHDFPKTKLARWEKPDFGFEWVGFEMQLDLGVAIVNLSHFPYYPNWLQRVQSWFGRYDTRHIHRRLKNDGRWLVHGHTHRAWRVNGRMISACMDAWGWRPAHLSEIRGIIRDGPKTRRIQPKDKKVGMYCPPDNNSYTIHADIFMP